MTDDEREDAATQDDNEDTDERPKPQVKKAPESTSAPAPGDDIIIK